MDPPCPLGPSLSMEEKKRCPMDPPSHVQWEEERLQQSCGPERCSLPTCVRCDCGAAEEGVSVSVVPLRGFPSADPLVGCATQALGSGCDTRGVLCTDVVRVIVHWVLSHRYVTC